MRTHAPLSLALLLIMTSRSRPRSPQRRPRARRPRRRSNPRPRPNPIRRPRRRPNPPPSRPPSRPRETPGASAEPTTATSPSADSTAEPTRDARRHAIADPAPAPERAKPTTTAKPKSTARGSLDARSRYIVVLKPGSDVVSAERRTLARGATLAGSFKHAVRGYVARLTASQKRLVAADPAVADDRPRRDDDITAQSVPRACAGSRRSSSSVARIDGVDERVNADVAIVDTGHRPAHPTSTSPAATTARPRTVGRGVT